AALGYLGLRVVASCYRMLRRREGLGRGDAKLLAASGAWVGAGALAQVVFGAAVTALAAAACLRLCRVRLRPLSGARVGPVPGFRNRVGMAVRPVPYLMSRTFGLIKSSPFANKDVLRMSRSVTTMS